ncbi:MAG: hypothetical protein ABMA01_20290 [Chthoniobacteraceae bacterium]
MKPLLLSSILGALVAFFWGFLSWTVLPWHKTLSFSDDEEVAAVLRKNAAVHGIYMLPGEKGRDQAAMEKWQKQAVAGPFMFAVVRPGSAEISMGRLMAGSFGIQFIGAFLISALLLTARPMAYGVRVLFVVIVALAGGVLSHLPGWNWWETPTSWVLVQLVDLAIGWALAGLVIAKFANPESQR